MIERKPDMNLFEAELRAGLDPVAGNLEEALFYVLSVPGKRMRPRLFLTFIEAHGRDSREYFSLAAALEMIHTYSLIHDDLPAMDNDDLRRGMPTLHKKYDEALAILAGDTLLTWAVEKMAGLALPPETVVRVIDLVCRAIGKDGMAGGQVLDLNFTGNPEEVLPIHRKKTAALIKASLLAAAEVLEYTQEKKELVAEMAGEVGMAFQLADDLLDFSGEQEKVGKKLGKDKDRNRPNAVIHFGERKVRRMLDDHYKNTLDACRKLGIDYQPFLGLLHKMVYRDR